MNPPRMSSLLSNLVRGASRYYSSLGEQARLWRLRCCPGFQTTKSRTPNSSFTGKWSPSIILSLQNQHFFLEGIFVSLPLVILAPSFWRLLSVLLACAGIVVLTSIGCVFRIALVDILSQGAQCCHGGGLPVECDGNGSHASESDEQR